MSFLSRTPLRSAECLCVVVTLVVAVVASAAMIHVASDFGFTALGEPVVAGPHGR